MKKIQLNNGLSTIVDDTDYQELSKYNWRALKICKGGYYAIRTQTVNGKSNIIRMHALIAGTPKGMNTDHINGDTLDNRRKNLRVVTTRENGQNMHILKTSKYPGVSWKKETQKWSSHIRINGKLRHLGCYLDEYKAADAYRYACEHPDTIPPIKEKTSKYFGVYFDKSKQKWRAQIRINSKRNCLGTFPDEETAARRYRIANDWECIDTSVN